MAPSGPRPTDTLLVRRGCVHRDSLHSGIGGPISPGYSLPVFAHPAHPHAACVHGWRLVAPGVRSGARVGDGLSVSAHLVRIPNTARDLMAVASLLCEPLARGRRGLDDDGCRAISTGGAGMVR